MKKKNALSILKNSSGQGMIEYLILVAFMGVATIGVVRVLSQSVNKQLTNVTHAIQGGEFNKEEMERVDRRLNESRDMGSFLNGARRRDKDKNK